MSYINGNNIYGARTMNESPSRVYKFDTEEMDMEKDFSYDSDMESKKSCDYDKDCDKPHCDCNKPCDKPCDKPHDDCHKPCDKWECDEKNKCCTMDTCTFDPSKAKCVCAYLDILFNEDKSNGSTLFYDIGEGDFEEESVKYKPKDPHCCLPCDADENSEFEVDCVKVKFTNFVYDGTAGTFTVDGTEITNAVVTTDSITLPLPCGMFTNEDCNYCDKGTSVSILLNALNNWIFTAEIKVLGRVTTSTTTCKFMATFESTSRLTITDTSTFVAPEVCLPPCEGGDVINVKIVFDATAQLIDPVVTGSGDPLELALEGKLMVNPIATLQVVKNAKVCFNAMI